VDKTPAKVHSASLGDLPMLHCETLVAVGPHKVILLRRLLKIAVCWWLMDITVVPVVSWDSVSIGSMEILLLW
jgi:hypothetical protein